MKYKIDSQKLRLASQITFALICIWVGVEFHYYIRFLESGGAEGIPLKPGGVEAFLPISSLMSLRYFIETGFIHMAHPAGLVLFSAITVVSFLFGKSFCSWICPIGFISETIGTFGARLLKQTFNITVTMPRWLDYPLRSLKYLLLAFFAYIVLFAMTTTSLALFLDSPYNLISDIKMYFFFAEISTFNLYIVATLFFLSVFIKNFWCRYLCPYGALLGIVSLFGPTKIYRNTDTCIDCENCTRACPSNIKVHKSRYVISDECTSCQLCVSSCPVKDTLYPKVPSARIKIRKPVYLIAIPLTIFIFIAIAKFSGYWKSNTPAKQIEELYKIKDSTGHPRSASEY